MPCPDSMEETGLDIHFLADVCLLACRVGRACKGVCVCTTTRHQLVALLGIVPRTASAHKNNNRDLSRGRTSNILHLLGVGVGVGVGLPVCSLTKLGTKLSVDSSVQSWQLVQATSGHRTRELGMYLVSILGYGSSVGEL